MQAQSERRIRALRPHARSSIAALAIGLSVLAGCASSTDTATDEAAARQTGSTVAPTTTSTTTTTTTTTTLAPALDFDGVPRAARTVTNVVLPVLDEVSEGLLVTTPCDNTTIVQGAQVIDRVHVVLDPGHGGTESGGVSADGVTEKEVNLEVALQAEQLLADQGFAVTLTRYTDIRVPLVTRVAIADTLEADLLVSIHHQGSGAVPTSDESGVEVYYQQTSDESRRFAGLLVEETREEFGVFDVAWFAGSDAGAVIRPNAETGEDFYGMIRLPETPSVLAEMAFLGNEAEVALMRTGELQKAEAAAISDAVVRWFTTADPGSGFVESSFGLTSSGGGGGLGNCEDPDLGPTVDATAAFNDEEATEE